MASDYGYTTVAALENYSGIDYSAKQSKYTDSVIEAQITAAEEIINTYMGQSFSGTIPDGVKYATKVVAHHLLHNMMLFDGNVDRKNFPDRLEVLTEDVMLVLDRYKTGEVTPINLHRMYE